MGNWWISAYKAHIVLDTQLYFVLCLVLPVENLPIAHKYPPTAKCTPEVSFGSGVVAVAVVVHFVQAPIKLSKLSDKSVWDEQLGQVQALPIEQLSLGS